jgi:hypothetical protein
MRGSRKCYLLRAADMNAGIGGVAQRPSQFLAQTLRIEIYGRGKKAVKTH